MKNEEMSLKNTKAEILEAINEALEIEKIWQNRNMNQKKNKKSKK